MELFLHGTKNTCKQGEGGTTTIFNLLSIPYCDSAEPSFTPFNLGPLISNICFPKTVIPFGVASSPGGTGLHNL